MGYTVLSRKVMRQSCTLIFEFSPARYAEDATAVRPELRLTVLVEQ